MCQFLDVHKGGRQILLYQKASDAILAGDCLPASMDRKVWRFSRVIYFVKTWLGNHLGKSIKRFFKIDCRVNVRNDTIDISLSELVENCAPTDFKRINDLLFIVIFSRGTE